MELDLVRPGKEAKTNEEDLEDDRGDRGHGQQDIGVSRTLNHLGIPPLSVWATELP